MDVVAIGIREYIRNQEKLQKGERVEQTDFTTLIYESNIRAGLS